MNYYFVTGSSRGIGEALCKELLKTENNYVIGLSRTNTLKHERFEHICIDLGQTEKVKNYQFIKIIDAKSITLINNSGMLGQVKKIGAIENQSIIDVFNLNIIAPFILMNNFIKEYQALKIKKLILNISSGAGRHPIEAWSAYCASKSALDMLSEVANKEQNQIETETAVKVLSIAPGIVDTVMQDNIRKTDKQDFSSVDIFIGYKNENKLVSPDETAKKLARIMENSNEYTHATIDIREIDI